MQFPNKLYSYDESILSSFSILLKKLSQKPYSVSDLYHETRKEIAEIAEYIEALDCLYALGKIRYDEDQAVLTYVI